MLPLITFTVNNQKTVKEINLYTVFRHGISTTFTDQLATFHVFSEMHPVLASEFLAVYYIVSQILRMKRHNLKWHYEDA
jgi:hypothetical protein